MFPPPPLTHFSPFSLFYIPLTIFDLPVHPAFSLVSHLSSPPPSLPASLPSPPAAPLTWEKCFSLIFTSSSTSLCLWVVSSWSLLSASSRLRRSSSNICRRACASLSWERQERRRRNRWSEDRGGKKNRVLVEGKLRRGQYVNFRQILQYKVNNCQKRHMRIKVPMQGFVKSIPQVCV